MTQFTSLSQVMPELSAEAKKIISEFCCYKSLPFLIQVEEGLFVEDKYTEPVRKPIELMASLYAMSPNSKPSVKEALSEHVIDLNDVLSSEQINALFKEYANIVLYCFITDGWTIGYDSNYALSCVDLCLKIAQCKPDSKIYLPFNGYGLLSHQLMGCRCEGFEPDRFKWAISEILNSAFGADCDIECSASPNEAAAKEYDYVFYNFDISNFLEHRSEAFGDVLANLIRANLKEDGELYAIVPFFYINHDDCSNLRKTASDLKASIILIELPRDRACLIRIKKDGLGDVVLADFSNREFISTTTIDGIDGYRHELKIHSMIELLNIRDKKNVWSGAYSDLNKKLLLNRKRYLPFENMPTPSDGEKLVKLGDLIECIGYSRLSVKTQMPLINISDLFDNYLNCELSANKSRDICKMKSVIDKECLLVGFEGGKVKVAKLKDATETNPVFTVAKPFRITSNEITEDYLLRSLLGDFSREQFERLDKESMFGIISDDDLRDVLILVPSLEKQQTICYNDAHAYVKEADVKLQDAYEEYRKDIHMKKHAIGQTLANLNNWWELLGHAKDSGNGIINENDSIGKLHKVSVKKIFDNIDESLLKLHIQFNKFDSGYGQAKEKIALTEFVEKYIKGNRSPLFRYEYDPTNHRMKEYIPETAIVDNSGEEIDFWKIATKKENPLEYVNFPKGALTTIFDDIVSNACAHGFADREDGENIIKIEIGEDGSDYIVSVSNNGKPLDPQISCEDITVYGQTSGDTNTHYGIGGYEIKRLMEEFGGKVEIISEPEKEFTVTYKLIFPRYNN